MSEISYKTCSAGGCPCDGVHTESVKGSEHWYCGFHFGCEPDRVHEITAALVRMRWLVQLCKGIRHDINTGIWTEAAAQGYQAIAVHERRDLYQKAGTRDRRAETKNQWLARLDGVLAAECKGQPDTQQLLDVEQPEGE